MESESSLHLLAVLALMFFGALGASYLAYHINVPEARMQSFSALGGGLLIGSALTIIIPEGFHAFHQAAAAGDGHHHDQHGHQHDHDHSDHSGVAEGLAGLALLAGFLGMLLLDQFQAAAGGGHGHGHHHHAPGKHTHSSEGQEHGNEHPLLSLDLEARGGGGSLPLAAAPKPKGPSIPTRTRTFACQNDLPPPLP